MAAVPWGSRASIFPTSTCATRHREWTACFSGKRTRPDAESKGMIRNKKTQAEKGGLYAGESTDSTGHRGKQWNRS